MLAANKVDSNENNNELIEKYEKLSKIGKSAKF